MKWSWFGLLVLAAACNKGDGTDKGGGEAPAALDGVVAIMTPYESCRAHLAADNGDLADCAAKLAASARASSKSLAAAKEQVAAIASAAEALAKLPAEEVEAVRKQFGEVSRPIEQLLKTVPEAAGKFRVYECPMAQGFKRWAQLELDGKAEMGNPYMGTRMLQCGSDVTR